MFIQFWSHISELFICLCVNKFKKKTTQDLNSVTCQSLCKSLEKVDVL